MLLGGAKYSKLVRCIFELPTIRSKSSTSSQYLVNEKHSFVNEETNSSFIPMWVTDRLAK